MFGITLEGPWPWLVGGLALVGLEVVVPGMFLIWFGIAALLTGAVDAAFGLPWQLELVLFALLAVLALLIGRRVMRQRPDPAGSGEWLNRRGEALVGRVFTLDAPITMGEGRVRIDDSSWRIVGPVLPTGASVRVTRIEGATLIVEPVTLGP